MHGPTDVKFETVTVQGHEMLRDNEVDLPREGKSRSDNFYSV
jgi:hypothetical protein